MNRGKVNYILFDLVGTLIDIPIEPIWSKVNQEGIEEVIRHLNLLGKYPNEKTLALVQGFVEQKKKLRIQAKQTLEEFPLKEQLKNFFEREKEIDLNEEILSDLEERFIIPELKLAEPITYNQEILQYLIEKGYTLILITNNVSRLLTDKILAKFSLSSFFDKVYVSEDFKIRKPKKEFLKHFFDFYGCSPAECALVGDRLGQDIALAKKWGMLGVHVAIKEHVDNRGLFDKIVPNEVIANLSDLKKIF